VRERRERVPEAVDAVRRLLCHEPRGHADMYGCFLVPPDDDGADLGVLFWHKDGYSTACGHGTIALGRWAVDTGIVDGPEVVIDVPSGRVVARVGEEAVTFRNVPAYVVDEQVAYGGAFYAAVPAADLGLRVVPEDLPALIEAGRRVKRERADVDLYGTIFYEELGPLHQRNVTIFADGEVDRSPCGSGTSARCAQIGLRPGEVFRHDSIVGTTFLARVAEETPEGVVTEVEGTAFKTGEHRFTLDPRDPLGTGFVLR
jgi:proline racemase